jgi:hypothetical protein
VEDVGWPRLLEVRCGAVGAGQPRPPAARCGNGGGGAASPSAPPSRCGGGVMAAAPTSIPARRHGGSGTSPAGAQARCCAGSGAPSPSAAPASSRQAELAVDPKTGHKEFTVFCFLLSIYVDENVMRFVKLVPKIY